MKADPGTSVHGRRHAPLFVSALAAVVLLALPAGAQALEQTLLAGDGAVGDEFGFAVAIDGDTAVVGAPEAAGGLGAVYVFTRSGESWSQTAKLTASVGTANDGLGSSVAIDGETIVAGASGGQGSVYTFARSGAAARTETAKLTASDGAADDRLGDSVAIDGETIVAGAPGDDIGGFDQGSAYTFAAGGTAARTETAKLTASDGAATDRLGDSVAIDGDTIVAGAPGDDIDGFDQGSVYTFASSGAAARTETAKLTSTSRFEDDQLGVSVAIDGDTIVAGAPFDVGVIGNEGSLYTFARAGAAARTETAKLTASDGGPIDQLGASVAIDGNTIVAGAPGDEVGVNELQGSVYSFTRSGAAARTQIAAQTATDGAESDFLGISVAIDGVTILAGAFRDDVGANVDQGSTSVLPVSAAPIANPPTNTASPELTGKARLGRRLRASTGSWTGTEPLSFSYDWARCNSKGKRCKVIAGANAKTYKLKRADIRRRLEVAVTAENSAGQQTAVSPPSKVVKRRKRG